MCLRLKTHFEIQCTSRVDGMSMAIKATEVLIISKGPGQPHKLPKPCVIQQLTSCSPNYIALSIRFCPLHLCCSMTTACVMTNPWFISGDS